MRSCSMRFALAVVLVVTAQSHLWSQSYSGGSGTPGDPYLIANKADLKYLSENSGEWSKHFKQTANIAFIHTDFESGGEFYNGGTGFLPIGLSGFYDGGGFSIDSLYINSTSAQVGMFSGIVSPTGLMITNLALTNVNITGSTHVGALVGSISVPGSFDLTRPLVVTNCYVTGSVTGTSSMGGGLVGSLGYVAIANSFSACNVTSTGSGSNYGGFVGYSDHSTIQNCYATGSVTATSGDQVGGFIGWSLSANTINCYSTGPASGSANVGGFIGLLNYSGGTPVSNCFWDTQTSGSGSSDGGTGKTTAQMQTQSTFADAGWDFSGTWFLVGPSYPRLVASPQPGPPEVWYLSPTDGETVTYSGENLVVTFNKTVVAQSGNYITIYDSTDFLIEQIAADDAKVTVAGSEVTIDPVTILADGGYYVRIDAGAFVDTAGQIFAGITDNASWNFSVHHRIFATTTGATEVRSSSATLTGSVQPEADTASVRFLYGTTSGVYTDSVAATPDSVFGLDSTPASTTLTGLSSQTTYFFTIAAHSSSSYARGIEGSFKTTSAIWGNALTISGSGSYAKSTGPVTTATDDFTIEAWVKWDGTSTGGAQMIAANGYAGSDGYGMYLYSDNNLSILVSGKAWLRSSLPLTAGVWTHVAMVRGAGTWRLYKDGVSLSLGGDPPTFPHTPNSNFFVGGDSVATSFHGTIDEVRVSNTVRYSSSFNRPGPFASDAYTAALYHFSEGVDASSADSSGHGHHLSFHGAAAWSANENAIEPSNPSASESTPGSALRFTGDTAGHPSNYVQVSHSSALNPSDHFTVELWARAEGGDSLYRCAIGSQQEGPAQGYAFYADFNDKWAVVLGDSIAGQTLVEGSPVVLNVWTHLALTYASGTFKFYVNGTLAATTSSIAFKANTFGPFRIGDVGQDPGYLPFNGTVDEIRVWSVARTEQEIRETMHRTVAGNASGLTAYFQLNQGSGTTTDGLYAEFTGTIAGSPAWVSSTVPVGDGTSTSVASFTTGTASLGTVSLTTTEAFDNAIDLTATEIHNAPDSTMGIVGTVLADRYWTVNSFGTPGTFAATLTFTVPASFTGSGAGNAALYTLYHRNGNGDGAWAAAVSGASALTATTVTFDGVSSFSQFALGTEDALPVQLVEMRAEVGRQRFEVRLTWSTATEVDNAGWEVERRAISNLGSELANFQSIGFVEGAGTSTTPREYTFTDTPQFGDRDASTRFAYRLKQIDRTGSFAYSNEFEVALGEVPGTFSLEQNFPNPFNPATTIRYALPSPSSVKLVVYDLLSREVRTLVDEEQPAGWKEVRWEASTLPSGIYFYRLTAGEFTQVRKLMLLK